MVRNQETAHPVNFRFPRGPLCQQIPAVPLPDLEEKLVGAKGAAEDDADHPRQLQIAAVGETAGYHADHPAFQKGTDPQGRISVRSDEGFQIHVVTLAQKCNWRLRLAVTCYG